MKQYQITEAKKSKRGVSLTVETLAADENGGDDPAKKEYRFLISAQSFEQLHLTSRTIDERIYARLGEAHILYEAVQKGIDLLSYTDQTKQVLTRKLTERGYPREIAEEAAIELEEAGLIREREQAERAAELSVRKRRGPSRIRSDLYQKGFEQDTIAHAIEYVEANFDFGEICAEVIRRKYGKIPRDSDERRKMGQYLLRSGFSTSHLRSAEKILRGET